MAGRTPYFDTLSVFVTLMLLGRLLTQRVLEKNQKQLLADAGCGSLLTRRRVGSATAIVPCGEVTRGDRIVVAAGDLVPVDLTLDAPEVEASLDWLNGESRPRTFVRGELLPAGAFNAGIHAVDGIARTDFPQSPLTRILRTPSRTTCQGNDDLLRRVAPIYVLLVLSLAMTAFALRAWSSPDLGGALSAATAMLVVTCPCALGIATPLVS